MDYKGLLDRVIDQYYSKNYEPDLKGYIKWREPTQREKDKSLKKTGKEIQYQRRFYDVIEEFYLNPKGKGTNSHTVYNYIYISPLEDDFFYVVTDSKFGMAGQVSRTKYQIKKVICSKCGHHEDELIHKIDDYQIMIR